MACLVPLATQASCGLSSSSVQFGGYNSFDSSPKDTVGIVQVDCKEVTLYNLKLSTGAGSYQQRYLQNGLDQLNYNLYIDASRKNVWGDGFGQYAMKTAEHSGYMSHDIYGQIPARQNVSFGDYTDLIHITLEY